MDQKLKVAGANGAIKEKFPDVGAVEVAKKAKNILMKT